jgi:hypothetical protein
MTTLAQVGIADMRKPNFIGSYAQSYAPNGAPPTGRNTNANSIQYYSANLSMGRYCVVPDVFDPNINPDAGQLTWIPQGSPARSAIYSRCLYWNQLYCSDPWKLNHLPGWINNTRVMMWGFECWIKSKATGQWTRRTFTDTMSGEAWSPNFKVYGGQQGAIDMRTEPTTGYRSVRLVYDQSMPTGDGYWIFHGYAGSIFSIDPTDVADVICLQKASLVVHDTFYADDRDYARFVLAMGGDWYPASGTLDIYPGIGTSRHKLVTAKWPNWQYHVMHTMTADQWNATNGYPSVFDTLSEGTLDDPGGDPGGGTGGNPTPQPVAPTRGNWFNPVHDAGPPIVYAWEPAGVANVAENKIRRRRGNKIRS